MKRIVKETIYDENENVIVFANTVVDVLFCKLDDKFYSGVCVLVELDGTTEEIDANCLHLCDNHPCFTGNYTED